MGKRLAGGVILWFGGMPVQQRRACSGCGRANILRTRPARAPRLHQSSLPAANPLYKICSEAEKSCTSCLNEPSKA